MVEIVDDGHQLQLRQHGSHMNILDHHQTLPNRGHGTNYIANQREYVEDRYDFNAATGKVVLAINATNEVLNGESSTCN